MLALVGSAARADPPAAAPSASSTSVPLASAPAASAVPAAAPSATKAAAARSGGGGGGGFIGGGIALLVPGIASMALGIGVLRPCGSGLGDMGCGIGQVFADVAIASGVMHAIAGITLISVGGFRLAAPPKVDEAQAAPKPLVEVGISPGSASLLYRF